MTFSHVYTRRIAKGNHSSSTWHKRMICKEWNFYTGLTNIEILDILFLYISDSINSSSRSALNKISDSFFDIDEITAECDNKWFSLLF